MQVVDAMKCYYAILCQFFTQKCHFSVTHANFKLTLLNDKIDIKKVVNPMLIVPIFSGEKQIDAFINQIILKHIVSSCRV
jgi:hypothetical protein